MEKEIKLSFTVEELQALMAASQKAFLETGKYYITRSEAEQQFGKPMIATLITNKLLKDGRTIKAKRFKMRFLLTDVIAAVEVFNRL